MTWRLFILSILMGMTLFLMWNNYQATGSISKSVNKSWRDVSNAEVVREAQKAWQKSTRQSSLTFKKFKDGRLMQDAVKFVDKITIAIFNVKTPDLLAELQKMEKTVLDAVLLLVWVMTGYLGYHYFSSGFTFFVIATSLLVHALYGPAWCMYELFVFLGLLGFIVSLITNNAVFTAFLLSGCYMVYALWRFVGPSDGNRLDRIEARIAHVQHELNDLGKQLSIIEDKVDLVRASKRESK
ncbi:uncharacterized protein LOC129254366 [Lytechinus pictus]|uniref:uncharacterized protein LOC129254366 n=1 Tax=Lytechinus pictus TaxID=7653 RepID=UPI0030BA17CD